MVIRIARPDEETMLVDHRIRRLDYLLCASPQYLAARGTPRTVGDLRQHAVLYQQHNRTAPSWVLEGSGGQVTQAVRPVLFADNLEPLLTAACAGLGIAAMPEYGVQSDLDSGRLLRVLPDYAPPSRMLQVIYPPARHLSAKVRLLTEFVRDWCAEGETPFPSGGA